MSIKYDYHEFLVCDDIDTGNEKPIPKEMLKKIPKFKGKEIHGTFGKFLIADFKKNLKEKPNEYQIST